MKKKIFTATLCLLTIVDVHAQKSDLTHYVNTLQGTHSNFGLSHGNTFPATTMPYAVHMWTPQTGTNGEGFKYLYEADAIRGFGQSHQCSPWVSDYAVYSFFPEVGELIVDSEKRPAKFSHGNEIGLPHYYSVTFDNGIRTEFSTTERGAHLRFSYPKQGDAWLIIDGYTGNSDFQIDPERRQVRGWVDNHRFVNHSENFRCYFVVQFDKEFIVEPVEGGCCVLRFRPGTNVQAKAASSYISHEQAELTLQQELGTDKNLEATKKRGQKTWNDLLGRIRVEGGSDEQLRTFYSCLFRANLFSRKFFEIKADGSPYYYSPYDGKIYDGYLFTDNGFWDTFRSQFPLTNILHPTQQGRYMQAMMHVQQKELGWFPSWSCPGETGGMVGNHSISLFADAWAKGIRTVNPDSLLKAYAHEAFNKGPFGGANGRQCWHEYFTLGYVPFPLSHGCVSQTLEYAYDDWCAYEIARQCGNTFYEEIFRRHLYNYRNLWDSATHFFRGRGEDGKWNDSFEGNDFDPLVWGGPYTEGNAWHYVWSVFHDVQGLINLFGSDEAFVAKLDSVWSQPSTVKPGWYGYKIHEMTGNCRNGAVCPRQPTHSAHAISLLLRRSTLEDTILGAADYRTPLQQHARRFPRRRGPRWHVIMVCTLCLRTLRGHSWDRSVRHWQSPFPPCHPHAGGRKTVHHRGAQQHPGERLYPKCRTQRRTPVEELHHLRRHRPWRSSGLPDGTGA